MIRWPNKDPDENLDYGWQIELEAGDAIATTDAQLVSGTITLGAESFTADIFSLYLSGGTDGELNEIQLRVTTTAGRIYEETAQILVASSTAIYPVTADELREHLREVSDPDATLIALIEAAQGYFEEATGKAVIERTEVIVMDAWPSGSLSEWWDGERQGAIGAEAKRFIELPRSPLISIDHVKTYDDAGAATVFSASSYFADTNSTPGRLALVGGAVWALPGRNVAGIEIQYKAGYSQPQAIPAPWKRAILQIAAHWYENRELVDLEGAQRIPMTAERIIKKYRIRKL